MKGIPKLCLRVCGLHNLECIIIAISHTVKTQIYCPYKSLAQFRQTGLDLVKEAFERKESIATGYFEVKYYDGYEDEDHEWYYPEITLNVVFYGAIHQLDNKDRDYLVPEDDQTYNNAG